MGKRETQIYKCKHEWCEEYKTTISWSSLTRKYQKHYHYYFNEYGEKTYFCSNSNECVVISNSEKWRDITFPSEERLLYHIQTEHKKNPSQKKEEKKQKRKIEKGLIKSNAELRKENAELKKINKLNHNGDKLIEKSKEDSDDTNKYFCNVKGCCPEGFSKIKNLNSHIRRIHESDRYFCPVRGCYNSGIPPGHPGPFPGHK